MPHRLPCSCPPPAGATGTQALLLVGYDTTRAGKEFLLAKNSLGAGWGEGGFARIALADACGLYQARGGASASGGGAHHLHASCAVPCSLRAGAR